MKDIILINGYRVGRPVLPTGIGYVAQAIEDAGFDYDVCDVNLQTHDQIVRLVVDGSPRYVGCGTMTYEVEANYRLLRSVREAMPEVVIILGGPHAIAAQSEIFTECPSIDIVIQGEGEKALVDLLHGVRPCDIPGALTKDSPASTPYEPLSIENIAFPKYSRFNLEKYGRTMNLASSRGCVYKCSFCGAPKFLGKKWREFKLERMIEEFEYWYGNGYRHFYFSDSLFALDKKRVIGFCTYVAESNREDAVFTADGLRADHLTLEILQHMKRANFKSLTLGVESVNDETLRFLNKGETFSQIDKAISSADSLDFDILIYLIVGAPDEKYDDAIKSIKYPLKYKNIVDATVSKLMPIRGTAYYDYAIQHDLVKDKSVSYPQHEAYGTNERLDTQNAVEIIWDSLLPAIGEMSRFLAVRCQIKKSLGRVGWRDISVQKLNGLTRICLKPPVFSVLSASFRMARSLGFSP